MARISSSTNATVITNELDTYSSSAISASIYGCYDNSTEEGVEIIHPLKGCIISKRQYLDTIRCSYNRYQTNSTAIEKYESLLNVGTYAYHKLKRIDPSVLPDFQHVLEKHFQRLFVETEGIDSLHDNSHTTNSKRQKL